MTYWRVHQLTSSRAHHVSSLLPQPPSLPSTKTLYQHPTPSHPHIHTSIYIYTPSSTIVLPPSNPRILATYHITPLKSDQTLVNDLLPKTRTTKHLQLLPSFSLGHRNRFASGDYEDDDEGAVVYHTMLSRCSRALNPCL